jgi:hypothetical protein
MGPLSVGLSDAAPVICAGFGLVVTVVGLRGPYVWRVGKSCLAVFCRHLSGRQEGPGRVRPVLSMSILSGCIESPLLEVVCLRHSCRCMR